MPTRMNATAAEQDLYDVKIVDTLKVLHLSGMRTEYERQKDNLEEFGNMPFAQRLAQMCTAQMDLRASNSLERRLHKADLVYPVACLEKVATLKTRTMNMEQYRQLGTCDFIRQGSHISFEGAAGTGKSYLACAIGNAACRKGYNVRYTRLPDLLNELKGARVQCEVTKVRNAYLKYNLVIIDDWLLRPVGSDLSFELLDIIDAWLGKTSLMLCSQYAHSEWYRRIDCDRPTNTSSTLAEAILDRIIHQMTTMTLETVGSLRKQYSSNGEALNNAQ